MDDAIAERLLEAEAALAGEDFEEAERLLLAIETEHPEEAEVWFMRGHLLLAQDDLEAAQSAFEKAVQMEPKDSEAWYELAGVKMARGDEAGTREALLTVLRLDQELDAVAEWLTDEARAQIATFAEKALERLPAQFRDRLENVAVMVDDRPPKELVSEGFDPRALALFEGPDDFEQRTTSGAAVPTRIVLFAANLLADFMEPELLEHEVWISVLHEVGHYFGLDEEEVEALGLA